ncbi:MAG: TIGR03435 family protein [Verrucomicrobiales bacterium]|nr:TIGR03435 family protein [Verrucomicrobiales bacterium]
MLSKLTSFQAFKRHGVALGAILAMVAGRAGAATVSAGERPPPFTLEDVWNLPPGSETTWSALRGNVVVLDFWSTKCGPCVQGIPEFNRLVNQCRDLPVRFVAVTDEKPEVVRRFLREHPMEGWIGLDTDGSMIRDFEVVSRPCVVVVDSEGRIAAVTRPYALSRDWIRAVIEGRSEQWMEPLVRLDLRRHPGVAGARSGSFTDHGVRLNNAGFEQILGLLSPHSGGRLDLRTTIPAGDFDFEVTAKGGAPDAWREVLRQSLESMLGLKSREEPRSTEVFLLQPAQGRRVPLAAGSGNSVETSSPTGFVATSTTMAQFAANLGIRLGRPVLNRTGIHGAHRIELTWDQGSADSLIRAVDEQLGLAMVPAVEPLTYQVVEAIP